MKIEYIKRGAATRLIIIFAGWSTDTRFYKDCTFDGWDTAIVSDYSDLILPEIPKQYSSIYLFAYSLGVWAASVSKINATVKVAICGTPLPVSDEYGIPELIFKGTADRLSAKSLDKFHLRMAGNRLDFERLKSLLPVRPNIDNLKQELYAILHLSENTVCTDYKWNRAYIANADNIIPTSNQTNYWNQINETESIVIDSSHFTDISTIIIECIPNLYSIGEGFAHAASTYRFHATVQSEICIRIGEILKEKLANINHIDSLLEIGPGNGLLTDEWCKYIKPDKATYVDLYELKSFGKASDERYILSDAEKWIESTDEKFDIILSASAIQWLANPIRFVEIVRQHLKPGGIAILSTFTKGNIKELDTVRTSPIIYHTVDEYKSIGNIETESWKRTLHFESSREMLLHLKRTGVKPLSTQKCSTYVRPLPLSSLPTNLTYTPLILTLTPNPL